MARGHSRFVSDEERARVKAATKAALGDDHDVPDDISNLRGGGDPTEPTAEMDPVKLAAGVPRDHNR